MDELQVTARARIHDGKLAEFKEVAARCMRSVRENDTGTLQYDWFIDDGGNECVVREMYRDSDAVLEHIGNLGDTFGDLLAVCDLELEIYGSPSDALMEASAALAPKVYRHLQSI